MTELADGGFDLVTVGRRRFRIEELLDAGTPYLTARVQWLPEGDGTDEQADRLAPRVLAVFRQYLRADPPRRGRGDLRAASRRPDGAVAPGRGHGRADPAERQRLLALTGHRRPAARRAAAAHRETALLRQVRAVPVPLAELGVTSSPN